MVTWWIWPLVAVAVATFARFAYVVKKETNAFLKQSREQRRRQAFEDASEERRMLERHIKSNPQNMRRKRPAESPWNYVRNLADEGRLAPLVKPWEPSWGQYTMFGEHVAKSLGTSRGDDTAEVCTTPWSSLDVVRYTWVVCWTATVEGLVHRVARLPFNDGTYTHVFACEPTTYLAPEANVQSHVLDKCPVITCLACATRIG